MTGEEVFSLLKKMAERGDSPRKREKQLQKVAKKQGLSSDALRAKARRFAKKAGETYPLMRQPGSEERERERVERRTARSARRDERLRVGEQALKDGADWARLAELFGIKTPEGAAQWWRRNHDGKKTRRRSTRGKRRARAAQPTS